MNAAKSSTHDFAGDGARPATDSAIRALLLQQAMMASGGQPPSRFKMALRTAMAVLVLGAAIGILAVVGIALFIFTVGIAMAAAAALLVFVLVDRLRGGPQRRAMIWRG